MGELKLCPFCGGLTAQAAEIAQLNDDNFKLSARACVVEGGLVGDEHGHPVCTPAAENAALREGLAMSIAEMARARGRLEAIASCNEDRRIAASLGSQCDFARALLATPEPSKPVSEGGAG